MIHMARVSTSSSTASVDRYWHMAHRACMMSTSLISRVAVRLHSSSHSMVHLRSSVRLGHSVTVCLSVMVAHACSWVASSVVRHLVVGLLLRHLVCCNLFLQQSWLALYPFPENVVVIIAFQDLLDRFFVLENHKTKSSGLHSFMVIDNIRLDDGSESLEIAF